MSAEITPEEFAADEAVGILRAEPDLPVYVPFDGGRITVGARRPMFEVIDDDQPAAYRYRPDGEVDEDSWLRYGWPVVFK